MRLSGRTSEVPLVTFSGLAHLRITLAALILGGARRRDNGGVDNAAFTQHQAVFLQVLVHLFEQCLAQTMALQKMPELKNGAFVRQTVQLQARKVPHGFDLVQGVFHGRITEVIKELHAVNAQHRRQRVRRSTGLALGVIAGHFLLQLLPGNQFVHPFQKDLATSFALLVLVFGFGEGDLTHGSGESCPVDDGCIIADSGDLFRGSLDKDGYLYVRDRIRDLIISGGFNIFPHEVEQALLTHPAIQECAVVGVLHEKWGEAVTGVIELVPGVTLNEEEIMQHYREALGSMKTPKRLVVMNTLPRSAVGKVLKREIRRLLNEQLLECSEVS